MFVSSLWADTRYAFIYSSNLDDRFINFYDKVVVDSEKIDNIYALRYPKKMVAHVNVGEIDPSITTKENYEDLWVINKSKTRNTLIVDLTNSAYKSFLFEKIEKIYQKGYRNFFLDGMNAYHITSSNPTQFQAQQSALISIVKKLHTKYPQAKIITNRGFEILDKIYKEIDAVAVEGLIYGYSHEQKSYLAVEEKDRISILDKLTLVKGYGLDAIAIDYSSANAKGKVEIAKGIRQLGVIPYVSDALLEEQGECNVERIRRDILILYHEYANPDENRSLASDIHHTLSLPIEHLGYVPILHDVSKKALPNSVEDNYHAVIIWEGNELKENPILYSWIEKVMSQEIKILFLGDFPFNESQDNLEKFGLSIEKNNNKFTDSAETFYPNNYEPFEHEASISYEENILNALETKEVVDIEYANGQNSTVIGISSWGGFAVHNSLFLSIGEGNYWTIDPYQFLKEVLALKNIPMPDPTTEAGRRILFIHVDGDGLMEPLRMEKDTLSLEYLIDNIYLKYKLPQTVSIIQGEVEYLFPKLRERMRDAANRLYQIPWIEPASHTLSHPFFWHEVIKPENASPEKGKKVHLPLKDYYFSLEKETIGSIDYLQKFTKHDKYKEKILFWTGDCNPTKEVLAYVERKGILAMNGGDTTINRGSPTLNYIAPLGIQKGDYWQIYTGQQNENVYTNDWIGPFWAFRKVIDTFKMTGEPHRVKAINIYYHFYAASRLAAFNALKEVYDWAEKQKTSKLYASQYIKKTSDFYRTAIAKRDGGFEIRNAGHLTTLRFDKKINIDIAKSIGVAGYIHDNNRTYVSLDKRGKYFIHLGLDKKVPHLIDSNGWVEAIEINKHPYEFELKANVPLEANFHLPSSCEMPIIKGFKKVLKKNTLNLISKTKRGATFVFKCQ